MKSIIFWAALAAVFLAAIGGFAWREMRRERLASNERSVDTNLRLLRAIQLDLRAPGGYSTGTVADLIGRLPAVGSDAFEKRCPLTAGLMTYYRRPLDVILAGLSEADPSRPNAKPFQGFWYVAMPLGDPKRFAFCAYPEAYRVSGIWTYIVGDERYPTGRDLEGAPVLQWPPETELRTVWPICISG